MGMKDSSVHGNWILGSVLGSGEMRFTLQMQTNVNHLRVLPRKREPLYSVCAHLRVTSFMAWMASLP